MSCAGRYSMRSHCRLCNSVLIETCRLFLNGRLCKLNLPTARESVSRLPLLHTGSRSSKRTSLQIATFACRLPHEPPCGLYFCASESESVNTTIQQLPRWFRLQCRFRTGKRITSPITAFATPLPAGHAQQDSDSHLLQLRTQRSAHGNARIINFASRPSHGVSECGQRTDHSTCCRKSWKRSSLG